MCLLGVLHDTVAAPDPIFSLQWRHNGRDGVSNQQLHHCLLNRLFRSRSKKTSKLRVTDLCAGNSPVTGEFPAQMGSNGENVSIWWRHHVPDLSVNKDQNLNLVTIFIRLGQLKKYTLPESRRRESRNYPLFCHEKAQGPNPYAIFNNIAQVPLITLARKNSPILIVNTSQNSRQNEIINSYFKVSMLVLQTKCVLRSRIGTSF